MKISIRLVRDRACGRILVASLGALACTVFSASAAVINFDDITGSLTGTLAPGDVYQSQGITFSTGSAPDAMVVGTVFTLAEITPDFLVYSNTEAPSGFNSAGASQNPGDSKDLLMSFSTPVTSFSLRTDHASETSDPVRLLALAATGNPNEYRVVAFVDGVDNATSAPADTLTLTLANTTTPFSYVLFQTFTESESLDDVTFQAVPEPSSAGLLALAGVLGVASRRRR
jgi:hypothetical protein